MMRSDDAPKHIVFSVILILTRSDETQWGIRRVWRDSWPDDRSDGILVFHLARSDGSLGIWAGGRSVTILAAECPVTWRCFDNSYVWTAGARTKTLLLERATRQAKLMRYARTALPPTEERLGD